MHTTSSFSANQSWYIESSTLTTSRHHKEAIVYKHIPLVQELQYIYTVVQHNKFNDAYIIMLRTFNESIITMEKRNAPTKETNTVDCVCPLRPYPSAESTDSQVVGERQTSSDYNREGFGNLTSGRGTLLRRGV